MIGRFRRWRRICGGLPVTTDEKRPSRWHFKNGRKVKVWHVQRAYCVEGGEIVDVIDTEASVGLPRMVSLADYEGGHDGSD